ncbi:MAG: hypothetical protein HYS02_00755 [Candidatus Staskawiczbacteria bacterium]|nr:hypothetical protein [Candidatus Staskawiczbacteria bacterium]
MTKIIRKTIVLATVALAVVAMITPVSIGAVTIAELQAQLNALLAQLAVLQGQQTASGIPAACAGITFTRNLTVGSTGSDVKCLQALLNTLSATQVSITGAGSPGSETMYFGPKTLVAVRTYQAQEGWIPANRVGPFTIVKLNAWLASGSLIPTPTPATTPIPPATTPIPTVGAGIQTTSGGYSGGGGGGNSDTTAPLISSVSASNITTTGVVITWATDEYSETQIEYGLTNTYGSSSTLDIGRVASHSVTLSNLALNTIYHYRIKSKDASGNETVSGDFTFQTGAVIIADTTAPVISNIVSSDISSNGATISWTTDEASDAKVQYGLTTSYGNSTETNNSLVTVHAETFGSLQPSATYHYIVISKDVAGNTATSADNTFTTLAPPIQNLAPIITSFTNNAVDRDLSLANIQIYPTDAVRYSGLASDPNNNIITWTWYYSLQPGVLGTQFSTGQGTVKDAKFNYVSVPVGTTYYWTLLVSDGFLNTQQSVAIEVVAVSIIPDTTAPIITFITSHIVSFSGFTPNTTYYYRVKSKDASGNLSTSAGFIFTTVSISVIDTAPPDISAIASSSITNSDAMITWTTNEASDTQVEYGTTAAYGSSTALNASMATSHSQPLSGLTANTLHHYRVKSRDSAGNLAASGDSTFTTTTLIDATPPIITVGPVASSATANSATMVWITNEASDTQVEYGTTTAYENSTVLNNSMVTSHSAELSGLAANTLYHSRVKSRDAAGNLAVSGDYTFTTSSAPPLPPPVSQVYSYNNAPPLPAPTGTIINVSTVSELRNAVQGLQSGQTILIATGTYDLTGVADGLYINKGITNWAIRGATGNRSNVVIKGNGMTGSVRFGFWMENVTNGTIADLTIDSIRDSGVQMQAINGGSHNILLHNLEIMVKQITLTA